MVSLTNESYKKANIFFIIALIIGSLLSIFMISFSVKEDESIIMPIILSCILLSCFFLANIVTIIFYPYKVDFLKDFIIIHYLFFEKNIIINNSSIRSFKGYYFINYKDVKGTEKKININLFDSKIKHQILKKYVK